MTDPARRALCYIAIGLCTGKLPRSIYDPVSHRRHTYTGVVDPHGVHLQANEDHQEITGEFINDRWQLTLRRTHERFEIYNLKESFHVFDRNGHAHYHGSVRVSQVSIAEEPNGTPITLSYEAA